MQNLPLSTLLAVSTPWATSKSTSSDASLEEWVRRSRRVSRHSSWVTTSTTSAGIGVVGQLWGEEGGVWFVSKVESHSWSRAVKLIRSMQPRDKELWLTIPVTPHLPGPHPRHPKDPLLENHNVDHSARELWPNHHGPGISQWSLRSDHKYTFYWFPNLGTRWRGVQTHLNSSWQVWCVNPIEGYQPAMLRQFLNLTPPVLVQWNIKLTLYQSLVVTIISSISKMG